MIGKPEMDLALENRAATHANLGLALAKFYVNTTLFFPRLVASYFKK